MNDANNPLLNGEPWDIVHQATRVIRFVQLATEHPFGSGPLIDEAHEGLQLVLDWAGNALDTAIALEKAAIEEGRRHA